MSVVHDRLRGFAALLLERHGALVDWTPEAREGAAILPPEVARRLGLGEEVRLTHDATDQGRGAWAVNLATDFLERAEHLVTQGGREARFRIAEIYLKKSAMDQPVARAFRFPNARVRLVDAVPARMEYHFWHIHAALHSEERWEELLCLALNARTGALLDLPDPMTMAQAAESDDEEGLPAHADRALRAAAFAAQGRARDFVARLEARLARDRRRLQEYYYALLEAPDPHRRRPADPTADADKRRAVEVELRRKLLELDQRFAVRTQLEPVALVRLDMPVLRLICEVDQRRAKGSCELFWNPLRKELEPLACLTCGQNIFSVHFDAQLMPVCGNCAP